MIFIYNRDEVQVDILDVDPIITEEIGKLRSLEFESEKEFEKGYRVVAKTEDGLFEFVIIDSEYQRDNIKIHTYFCQDSLIELQSIPILDKRPWGNIEVALKSILDSTRWVLEVRNGYNLTTVLRSSFYHVSALEAFSEIVEKYRSEWITEYKSVGDKITERRVVIYQRDGRSNGRLEFGKNIINFKRTILSEPIVTAIYPYGKGEDLGDGNYGRRISIEDVNNGIPYIENKQATELYGIGEKGNKKPLFAFLILEDVEDKNELKKLAQEELDIVSGIRAEHTVDAADIDIEAKIGYEVPVIDEEIGYRAYARIIKIVRQGKDVQLTFGTVTKKFVDSFQKSISKTNKAINDVYIQINNVRASADGKTTVFTGPTEPTLSNEGDLWYRENADGTVDMLLFKNGIWVEELSEGVFKELRADIEANTQLVNDAKLAADKASKSLQNILPIIDENTKIRQDLNGETGNTSLTTIRQSLDSFVSQFAKIPSNIASTVKVDEYGIPIPPYGINDIWIKDAYDFTQRYDIFDEDETKNLEEFLSAGVWISKVDKKEGEPFNWDDWQKVSSDDAYQLSTIQQDIDEIMLATQKGDLISAINIQAGRILMSSGDSDGKSRLILSKEGTYIDNGIIETAHIGDEVVTNSKIGKLAVGEANIQDESVGNSKIINLDVDKLSGNKTEFVQSVWNAINSSVNIDGNGMHVQGNWGGSIELNRQGLIVLDKIAGKELGRLYGLYRNADDPNVNNSLFALGLFTSMGYRLQLGVRNPAGTGSYAAMNIRQLAGYGEQLDRESVIVEFAANIFTRSINMNGNPLINASNAGYTTTSNTNGNCIEFNNGFKIQFKRLAYETRSTGFEGWGYPKPFAGIPYVFGSPARDDATSANPNIGFSNVNENACNVRISDKDNAYSIMVVAIGF